MPEIGVPEIGVPEIGVPEIGDLVDPGRHHPFHVRACDDRALLVTPPNEFFFIHQRTA